MTPINGWLDYSKHQEEEKMQYKMGDKVKLSGKRMGSIGYHRYGTSPTLERWEREDATLTVAVVDERDPGKVVFVVGPGSYSSFACHPEELRPFEGASEHLVNQQKEEERERYKVGDKVKPSGRRMGRGGNHRYGTASIMEQWEWEDAVLTVAYVRPADGSVDVFGPGLDKTFLYHPEELQPYEGEGELGPGQVRESFKVGDKVRLNGRRMGRNGGFRHGPSLTKERWETQGVTLTVEGVGKSGEGVLVSGPGGFGTAAGIKDHLLCHPEELHPYEGPGEPVTDQEASTRTALLGQAHDLVEQLNQVSKGLAHHDIWMEVWSDVTEEESSPRRGKSFRVSLLTEYSPEQLDEKGGDGE